ncbi:hypothetical protein APHAL10511_005566 [Amanita phalloides]|nr:hypothetical protein APHAL10511_005566 [Amanita phalloides]
MLPPSIEDILAPICVLFIGASCPTMNWIRDHAKPLIVCANVVRLALTWLKKHNYLYADIELNYDVLQAIDDLGGLPYEVEYSEHENVSSSTVSSYTPHADMNEFGNGLPSASIPFENIIVADLNDAATPAEMRTAAMHHLKSAIS